MPAIRSQTILTDGWEVETIEYGKRKVIYTELGGNNLRLTFYLDDIQIAQNDYNNPSLTEIYTAVRDGMFPGATISADGKTITVDEKLYVSWHLVQRNPLQLKILTSNDPPPANWWQQ